MRPPRRVLLPTAAALNLTADGRHRPPEAARDRGERVTAGEPDQDPLSVKDCQTTLARHPAERLRVEVTSLPGHLPDHRRSAADLASDVDEPPTLLMKTDRELLLLTTEMTMLALQPMPPEISVCFISQHPLR